MTNKNLSAAKIAKQDEYYTQMNDIQAEINAYLDYDENTFRGKTVLLPCDDPEWSNFTLFFAQNFERLGLKKLISTSYAPESKTAKYGSLFAYAASQNGETPKNERGKIFVLDHDTNRNGRIDFEDLEWDYLKGDGDFRSDEVCRLRDEADVIVTNPPFSMFREFWAWAVGSGLATKDTKSTKQFLIIGNMNAITYKEVFPLIKENMAWLGATGFYTDMVFRVPKDAVVAPTDRAKAAKMGYVGDYTRLGNSCWFTNLEHGRRHQPLLLMTMAQNIKHSKHKDVRGVGYRKYDNYDAIDVPFTDAIPSDYYGVMGVPISFLDKYCPEQFEIVGVAKAGAGVPLVQQELLNAIYSGPFVTAAKAVFSNSANSDMQRWKNYVRGNERRQDVLEAALSWVARGKENIEKYMGKHIADVDCGELKAYFTSVIDWIDGTFKGVRDVMCGLEWGELYERFHGKAYNADDVWRRVEELLDDDCVTAKRGVFEYVLGGEEDTKLLNVRVFDRKTAKAVYARQTEDARRRGVSNCPLCAVGHESNATRIWSFDEMDADHVTAWSKGGVTDVSNCQMLCKTHNRTKGNR